MMRFEFMPYLSQIEIQEHLQVRGIEITCDESQHLILTGPNGYGKSTLLRLINTEILRRCGNRVGLTGQYNVEFSGSQFPSMKSPQTCILAYFDAFRQPNFQVPQGPKNLVQRSLGLSTNRAFGDNLLQVFVNQYTQQAYAAVDNDRESVARIQDWFARMTSALGVIFEDSGLKLHFERKTFKYEIRLSDGRVVNFQTMADGHKAAIAIASELLLRRDVIHDESGVFEPDGIVLIDELETHLHLRLQEVMLPFLCDLFPQIQFIVATHSPAILTSVPNAKIFDLANRKSLLSRDLQGIDYGTLMTSHFGISSEYDLETTNQLHKLRKLYEKTDRSKQENDLLQRMALDLSSKSHTIAMEILLDLESNNDRR